MNPKNCSKTLLSSMSLCIAALLMGCATAPQGGSAQDETIEASFAPENSDPWEPMNRAVFKVNDGLDKWIAKPVAKGYVAVAPQFVETGVDNFFGNVLTFGSSVNNLMQGKWARAGHDGARFVLNTFAGLGGLVDVASEAGLEPQQREDFGQTLRYWGVPDGPYLVLPLLGPSTVTDTLAWPVNFYLNPTSYHDNTKVTYGLTAADLVNTRANLLGTDEIVSGDRYLFIREAYLQNREFMVNDGVVEDDFGGDLDEFGDF